MRPQKVVLHNLCEITSSKRIFVADYQSGGIPFYRGREISEKYKGNLDVSTELFISESKYLEIKEKFGVPEPGDLLLTSVGTLGNPYVVKEGEIFYFKDGNLTWFRNFNGLNSKFLFYWLVSPQGKAELKKCTIGSSQSAFTIVLLKDIQIELPPPSTQRRIADILYAYDDLIENNTRRIRILENMAQAIYRECFGKVNPESLPDGWEICKLGDLIDFAKGKKPKTTTPTGKTPLLLIESLRSGATEFTDEQAMVVAEANDIIMVMDGASSGSIYTGSYGAVGSTLGRYRPIDRQRFSHYHFYFFILENFKQISDNNIGSAIPHANKDFINQLNLVLPPQKTENQFHEQMIPIFDLMKVLKHKNANLRKTRDLLLPRLVSGEIDISGSSN
jgi:type I restriction enzyme S subunit